MTSTFPTLSPQTDPLAALIALSRFYGADPTMVLAGGGNTSVKVGGVLHVKASGHALATIGQDGFVALDRTKLQAIAAADFGTAVAPREAAYKAAILAARLAPEKNQRPSVEALLHELMPATFVVHTHATLVNTLTCHQDGPALAREILGTDFLWIPFVDPGYTLGRVLKEALQKRRSAGIPAPHIVLMANHGLIVAADEPNQIRAITDNLLARISARLGTNWQLALGTPTNRPDAPAMINTLAPTLRALLAESAQLKIVALDDSDPVLSFVGNPAAKQATAAGPLNPDQIVYCNSFPLWFDALADEPAATTINRLRAAIAQHQATTGYPAKIILVPGIGLFAAGDDYPAADTSRNLYLDAIKIMQGATRLGGSGGGISHLTTEKRQFIEEWEVEAYRKQIARGSASRGRARGKIALITGAAQGFGLEIAQQFAAQGGTVILADINRAGAEQAAAAIPQSVPQSRALGLPLDVTSPTSIAACIHQAVRTFGGFNVLVSNAGVLKAESVKSQSEEDFDFVTAVNYKGFFFCVQHAAPILALQHRARPDYRADIIQINSKSGLQGSNKNAAYSGSKFGGLGLTQSFALELIDDGIKVNAICPGNFFDGPLWSDPDHGLFVQYLRTGKVPGAKTIADVKKFYEAKVPMGRGCTTADVMQALFYLIDQQYETGQALPVTGGQVMLS